MIELNRRLSTVDLPYTVFFHGVTEEMFDELVDEDTKAELLDGVMIVHSPASPRHNMIASFLRRVLAEYADDRAIGEVFGPDDLIHLASGRKFAPEAFFLTHDQIPHPLPKEQFELTPDFIIEVLSPSNRDYDLDDKRSAYQAAGVREIWFVDPAAECVFVNQRGRRKSYTTTTIHDGQLTSLAIPGFWIDIAWLWTDPPPRVLRCVRKILK